MIYRVEYGGFADVEAENEDEAREMFCFGYHIYDEEWVNDVYVVDE